MVVVQSVASPSQGTAEVPASSVLGGDDESANSAAARKRKADEAGVVAARTDLASSPSFRLEVFHGKKMEGTLAVWRKKSERVNVMSEAMEKAAWADNPSQEEADEIFEKLKSGPLRSPRESLYLGLDLARLEDWVSKNHEARKDSPDTWIGNAAFRFDSTCTKPINKIHDKLKEIRDELKAYAALSNKTEVGTRTWEEDQDNALTDSGYAAMMEGLHIPSPSKPQEELQNFLGTCTSAQIEPWWPRRTPKKAEEFKRFSTFWSELVETSKKCGASGFNKPGKVEPTVRVILQWEKEDSKRNFSALKFPTSIATEKDAVQPILGALLRSLSQIRADRDGSLGRSDLRRERFMPETPSGPKRFVDFESNPLNPFTCVLLNQEISLVKEVKNIRRKRQDAKILHEEVSKQMCGHLAKRALVAFDVGDVGVDSRSAGVIMTPVYMQVISLELQGMGTANAQLKFERTCLWPLVNEPAFLALVEDEADKQYLRPRLFPAGRNSSGDSDLPKGMLHLWELLHSSDVDLGVLFFGAENQNATFIGKDSGGNSLRHSIGQLFGSGSQGLVYGVGKNEGLVVKASVVGKVRYIKRELMALQTLAQEGGRFQHIPELKGCGHIQYTIRDTSATVPALLMAPKGLPALRHLPMAQNKSQTLFTLWSNMLDALTYAHGKKVYHLDVSPRNIIFDGTHFVLVDWGCAACANEEVVGFRGSLAFAHAAIHSKTNKQHWKPASEHDVASLVFTVCALWEENPVPWPEFLARLGKGENKAFQRRRDRTTKNLVEMCVHYKKGGGTLVLSNMDMSTVRESKFKTHIKECIKDA